MTNPRYSQIASRVLAELNNEPLPPPSAAARNEAIRAIEETIRRKQRRVRAVRVAWGIVASASLAAGVVFAMKRAPSVVRSERPVAMEAAATSPSAAAPIVLQTSSDDADTGAHVAPARQALGLGAHVVALPHGHARLAFASGTQVDIDAGGEVTIVEEGASSVLALVVGALRANVAKLHPGERFRIQTSDAEVEVHGTSFRVATAAPDPSCGNGARTRVSVYEGIVSVRHEGVEDRLLAGEEWPRGCRAPTASVANAPAPSVRPSHDPTPVVEAPVVPSKSSLALQNDLFAQAIAAKRSGDAREAIAHFDALLARYPNGPLAESAAAERMKVLATSDHARAVAAATAYLAQHPNGFARADAEAILTTKP